MSLGMDKGCEHLSRGRAALQGEGLAGAELCEPSEATAGAPASPRLCSARPRALNASVKERKSEFLAGAKGQPSSPALVVPGMLLTWRKG